MMILIEPTIEYAEQIRQYRNELLEHNSSLDGTGSFTRYEDPADWIAKVNILKDPDTVPEGYVPAAQYIFIREEDRRMVGMIQIRHYLNEYLGKY